MVRCEDCSMTCPRVAVGINDVILDSLQVALESHTLPLHWEEWATNVHRDSGTDKYPSRTSGMPPQRK